MFESERIQYRAGLGAISVVVSLTTWAIIANSGLVSPLFLPSPHEVLAELRNGPSAHQWILDFSFSTGRVLAGFAAAAAVAIPLGLYIGAAKTVDAITYPLIELARYVPVPALVPLCILWAGVDELAKILVIFLGTVFQMVVGVAAAVRSTPPDLIDAARTLGRDGHRVLWTIVLPMNAPRVFDLLRLTLGWAWSYLVVAELIAAQSGLGYRVLWAQRYLQVGIVYFALFVLAFVGLGSDILLRQLRRRIFPWDR